METTLTSNNNFSNLLGWFFSTKSNYVFEKEPWNEKLFSKILCEMYHSLNAKTKKNFQTKKSSFLNIFDDNDYSSDFLSPIKKVKENFTNLGKKEFIVDAILHGSIGSLDYKIGWSDVDISLIIGKNSFESERVLSNLRREILSCVNYLFIIDPLQHHEFLISADITQNYSPNPSIPTVVLLNGKSLIGKKHVIHLEKQSTIHQAQKRLMNISQMIKNCVKFKYMNHHALNGVYLEENFKNKNNMYQLKYLLELIMTLPSYFLDACGKPCYKKYSFDIVRENKDINFEILEKASLIRSEWPNFMKHPFEGNEIPEWVEKELEINYFERTLNFCNSLINHSPLKNKSIKI